MKCKFDVGHRVIVREVNGYDMPTHNLRTGPMAGHYGKVIQVLPVETTDEYVPMIAVKISGRVDGPVSPGIFNTLYGQGDCTWWFFVEELEHAD